MEWSFSDVWYPEGDAEDGCFSSFCMEELVGETPFNYLEYGSTVPACLMWLIWYECNIHTLEDNETFKSLKISNFW